MHVLYIIPEEFNGTRWGGVTTYVTEIAATLRKAGHVISILTPGDLESSFMYSGIRVYKIVPRLHGLLRIWLFPLRRIFPDVYSYIRWACSVKEFVLSHKEFDIIEAPEWGASALCLFGAPPPAVVRLHRSSLQYLQDNRFPITVSDRIINALEWLSIMTASAVTSPTEFMIRKYKVGAFVLGLRGVHIELIRSAVSKSRLKSRRRVIQPTYVLTVGRVETGKGSVLLADAFLRIARDIPGVRLVYIGEDTHMVLQKQRQSCKEYIRQKYICHNMKDRVLFLERKDRVALMQYYRDCLCYVIASRGHENPSVALLEALQAGKAVVASDAGGIPEVVMHRKNGMLFMQDNESSLARALRTMLTNPSLRESCEKNARVTLLPIRYVARETACLYETLLQ